MNDVYMPRPGDVARASKNSNVLIGRISGVIASALGSWLSCSIQVNGVAEDFSIRHRDGWDLELIAGRADGDVVFAPGGWPLVFSGEDFYPKVGS